MIIPPPEWDTVQRIVFLREESDMRSVVRLKFYISKPHVGGKVSRTEYLLNFKIKQTISKVISHSRIFRGRNQPDPAGLEIRLEKDLSVSIINDNSLL